MPYPRASLVWKVLRQGVSGHEAQVVLCGNGVVSTVLLQVANPYFEQLAVVLRHIQYVTYNRSFT